MQDIREQLKKHISRRMRKRVVNARAAMRFPTSSLRCIPDFLIIGGQRCGTSSLYRYLGSHPSIFPSLRKETEYLSRRFGNGTRWYRAHFPLRATMLLWRIATRDRIATFEATPDYLFYPHAPARAAELLPEAKIVVLLRNPVERAWSHYRHMVRLGFEHLSFEDALAAEEDRKSADVASLSANPLHYAVDYLRFSYQERGLYAQQLKRWMAFFPPERVLVARSEDFFLDPGSVYSDVLSFLGVRPWRPPSLRNFSYASGRREAQDGMDPRTRRRLEDAFAPHNDDLKALLGRDFKWGDSTASTGVARTETPARGSHGLFEQKTEGNDD